MQQISSGEGRFYIAGDAEDLAEITYKLDNSKTMIVDHTYVSEQLRGQGAGEQLVKAVVDKARSEGLSVIPQCSYAAHQFKKHPEYGDVLKENGNGLS
ncbi:putative GNAT family acetyltransferase [Paenibacillus forsythiae]|uniref:GNAT family acetyltransferase n=1 Tax=Paenibacillus forsythiae TaxID=365616 RepID=A0ABU3H7C9_9BACL|nr:GNAT family N-acetyltransferase [Paenibacillus forsythiae]MDT3426734.1 putative GNAT family acetyltransferase [Paenibacillus forsythiae]